MIGFRPINSEQSRRENVLSCQPGKRAMERESGFNKE
jgi:hypothetical protein